RRRTAVVKPRPWQPALSSDPDLLRSWRQPPEPRRTLLLRGSAAPAPLRNLSGQPPPPFSPVPAKLPNERSCLRSPTMSQAIRLSLRDSPLRPHQGPTP